MKGWLTAAAIAAVAGGALILARPSHSAGAESAAASAAPLWTVDYGKSRLGFSGTQTGAAFEGTFGKYEATIRFDPDDPSTALIDVVVDMTSARTGDRQRDSALPGSDWFKAKTYPTARFTSRDVAKTAEGRYLAQGALDMRGVSKPVLLPFALALSGATARATGEARLLRTEWGVGAGEFAGGDWVGLDVKVSIDIVATR